MEIRLKTGDFLNEASELAVLGCFEDVALPESVSGLLEAGDFRGKPSQTLLLYPRGTVAPKRLLLVGLGERGKANAETIRRASAVPIKEAQKLQVAAVTIAVNGDLAIEPEAGCTGFCRGN